MSYSETFIIKIKELIIRNLLFGHEPNVVHDFLYLDSMISNTLSLDVKLDKHMGKAATMFSRLTKTVWFN